MRINQLDMTRAVSKLEELVLAAGVGSVKLGHDIEEMSEISSRLGRAALGQHFRDSLNELPPSRVLWVAVYDQEGNPAGMVAARYDDVEGWDLKKFITTFWSRVYEAECGGRVRLAADSCPFAAGVTGPFIYIGDGWISEQFRGGNLLANIQKMLILFANAQWPASLTYGWMRPDKVLKGYAARWGYVTTYPKGIKWEKPPAQKDLEDIYFVSVDKIGIRQMIADLLHRDPRAS